MIYVGFAAYCDANVSYPLPPGSTDANGYSGYMFVFSDITSSTPLSQLAVFDTNGGQGLKGAGIWQSAQAPAIDPFLSDVWFATGNGPTSGYSTVDSFGGSVSGPNLGQSVVGLSVFAEGTSLTWAPSNYASLANNDLDLGTAGPSLWRDPNLNVNVEHVFQESKTGQLYHLSFDASVASSSPSRLQSEADGRSRLPAPLASPPRGRSRLAKRAFTLCVMTVERSRYAAVIANEAKPCRS